MIGNDIIDLSIARAEKKSENPRFIEKVFSDREKSLILNAQDPELILWTLWSMKEAAYKAHQRNNALPRKIDPINYRCDYSSSDNTGKVSIGETEYKITSMVTQEYIHSITGPDRAFYKTFANNGSSKTELLARFISQLPFKQEEIEINKDTNGIPSISLKNKQKKFPFTLSHHGNFTAFCIPLINS